MTYYDLNMNNKRITACLDPSSNQDVATKNYVDTTGVASISAGTNITVTGTTTPTVALTNPITTQIDMSVGIQINMGNNKIISCADPTNAQDVATKNYVDTTATGGVYQPLLTTSSFNLPSGVLTSDGQQAFFINSYGDGGNEMTTLPTPNFTITCMTFVSSTNSFVVGGYNHIQGRAEVRCGPTIAAVVSSASFTSYIAFPTSGVNGYVNVLHQSPYISSTIAVGGNFQATTTDTYNGTNLFPSNVSNFLLINSNTTTITPANMEDSSATLPPFLGSHIYGVNGVVNCISSFSDVTNVLLATATGGAGYVLGGSFSSFLGYINQNVSNMAIFISSGITFSNPFPFPSVQTNWYYFGDPNGVVNVILNNPSDDTIVVGGAFTNIFSLNRSYLIFTNYTILNASSYINGFVPPSPVSGGCEAYITGSPTFPAYFGVEDTGSTPHYPLYTMNMNDMSVVPTVIKSDLPAVPLGFGVDKTASPIILNFVSGYNSGNVDNYVYDFETPHMVNLNGATNITSIYFDYVTVSPSKTPYFFRSGSGSNSSPYECYFYVYNTGGVVITTDPNTLPFVDATQPLNKYSNITLATYNNFAMGTLVGYTTANDVRLLIYSTNGATFSNN